MLKKTLITIALIAIVFSVFDYRTARLVTRNDVSEQFVIHNGDNLFAIGKNLARQDLIPLRYYFYYYAWKQKLRGKMIAGTYDIPPHASLGALAHIFTSGAITPTQKPSVQVTFPEGVTIDDMGQILDAHGLPGADFVTRAKNPSQELRAAFPFVPRTGSLEGYLFPDTYQFFMQEDATDIITKMLQTFDRRFSQQERAERAAQGQSLHEIVTLASLVEGEAKKDENRPVIAGIFRNRLDIGMPLQSDATIDYITGTAKIKHTLRDTEIDSPYNTYKYPGLPPGPINAPSLKSLRAAAHPAQTDYLYFLNNAETGDVVFAKTFQEHIDNKARNGL